MTHVCPGGCGRMVSAERAGLSDDEAEQLVVQLSVPDGPLDTPLSPALCGTVAFRERALLTELGLCGVDLGRFDRAAAVGLSRLPFSALLVARWLRDAHHSGVLAAERQAASEGPVSTGHWEQGSAGGPAVDPGGKGGHDAASSAEPYLPADPSDTSAVGDPDPTGDLATSGDCPAEWQRYGRSPWCCTRDAGHRGQHVAGNGSVVVAVWPQSTQKGDAK